MVKVLLGNVLLAESDAPVTLEGNYYFPPNSVKNAYFTDSDTSTACPWKGVASYYSADVDGKVIKNVAWYYPAPLPEAEHIKNHVAFYKNKVTIQD